MKIAYFVICVLLMIMKTNICLQAKVDHSLYISPNPHTNFLEMKTRTYAKSSMTTRTTGGLRYKAHIIVHKQMDNITDKHVEFDCDIELTPNDVRVSL